MPKRLKKSKPWSAHVEEHGIRVRVYERTLHGTLYLGVRGVLGRAEGRERKSLRHHDRALAQQEARQLCRALARARLTGVMPDTLTLGQLFSAYTQHRLPTLTAARQREAKARISMFTAAWGAELRVGDVDQGRVDAYCRARRDMRVLAPSRQQQPDGERHRGSRPPARVRDGALNGEFRWLRSVCNWARGFRSNGRRLLTENPLDGINWPHEKNPRRPVASHQRFTATMQHVDAVDTTGRLRCILTLARYTGRRESAICALRASDVLLTQDRVRAALAAAGLDERVAEHMPGGAIRWGQDTDKGGYLFISPLGPEAREAVDAYLRAAPRVGDVPLFPAPRNPSAPVRRETVAKWLVAAERRAGLHKLAAGTFHPYRRLWATERKDLPDVDVAAAGGWRDTSALRASYKQADPATVYRVVAHAG